MFYASHLGARHVEERVGNPWRLWSGRLAGKERVMEVVLNGIAVQFQKEYSRFAGTISRLTY